MGLMGGQIVVNNIEPWRRAGKLEMSLRQDQEIRSDVRQPVEVTALDQRGRVATGQDTRTLGSTVCVYWAAPLLVLLSRDSVFVAFITNADTEAQIGQNTDPRPQST